MWRLIEYPYIAALFVIHKLRGWCWPYCREYEHLLPLPTDPPFALPVRCRACGRRRYI